MAQIQGGFNPANFDPTQGVPQLPVGKHPVVITNSEIKANNKNDGGYLQLDLMIIDGPSKGASGADRLNLYHSNPQTVEIAHKRLSAYCHAIGYLQPFQDTNVLHNQPFVIEVALQTGEEAKAKGYTQVARVFDRNGNEPGKNPTPAQAQPAGGAGGGAWGGGGNAGAPAGQSGAWGGGGTQQQPGAASGQPWGQNTQQQQGQPGTGGGGAWGGGNAAPAGQAGQASPGWAQPGQQAGNGGGPAAGGPSWAAKS